MVEISEIYRHINPDILRGPVADPMIEMLLPRELLARIKVKALDMQIQQIEMQVDMLKLQKDLLVQEYKLG